jgi:hypothetical protein
MDTLALREYRKSDKTGTAKVISGQQALLEGEHHSPIRQSTIGATTSLSKYLLKGDIPHYFRSPWDSMKDHRPLKYRSVVIACRERLP